MNKYKMITICSLSIVCVLILSLLLPLTISANDKESIELKMHYEKQTVTASIYVSSDSYTGVVCKYLELDNVLTSDNLLQETKENGNTVNLNGVSKDNYETSIQNISKRYVVIYVSIGNCELCDYIDCRAEKSDDSESNISEQNSQEETNKSQQIENKQEQENDTQSSSNQETNKQKNVEQENQNTSTNNQTQNDNQQVQNEEVASQEENGKKQQEQNTKSNNEETKTENSEATVENNGESQNNQPIEEQKTVEEENKTQETQQQENTTVNQDNNQQTSQSNENTTVEANNQNNANVDLEKNKQDDVNNKKDESLKNTEQKSTSMSTKTPAFNGNKDSIDLSEFKEIQSVDKIATADTKMPQTGENDTVKILGIIIFSVITAISFYKYKATK